LDYRDTHGRTPFLLAVQGGNLALAKAIVAAHPHRLRESKDEYRPCALHLAARENLPAMLEWLVQQGLEVDFCTRPGDTALRTAVGNGHLEAARMLLQLGADIHTRDEFGGMLHSAWSFEMLKLLVEWGAEVNDVDNCGEWPLKWLCFTGDAEHVRWLLEHGAKPDLTSTGETALFNAVRSGSIACVELLVQAGASLNAQDCDGWTCLFYVGSLEMAEFLLARGADPSIPDQCGGLPEQWHGIPRAIRAKLRDARMAAKRH
jgi:ankyrin repeat protein